MPRITKLGGQGNSFICISIQFSYLFQSLQGTRLCVGAPRQFRPINQAGVQLGLGVQEAGGAQKRLATRDDVWGHFLSWEIRELTQKCWRLQGLRERAEAGAQAVVFSHRRAAPTWAAADRCRICGAGSSLSEPLTRAVRQNHSSSFSETLCLAPPPLSGEEPTLVCLTKSFLLGTISNIYKANRDV